VLLAEFYPTSHNGSMQSLFAFLTQLIWKTWIAVAVVAATGTAVTVFCLSPVKAGSTPPLVVLSQSGHVADAGRCGPVPVVPEANSGMVLVPVIAAMLLFSARRFWTANSARAVARQPGMRNRA
jgi:hypothetical protein